ncbi:MAG: leucyl aminopeptidase [Roseovarius sp.]
MTACPAVSFVPTDLDRLAGFEGRVAVFVTPDGTFDAAARRANRLTRGALRRLVESDRWRRLKPGEMCALAWPAGMAAEALDVVCLPRRAALAEIRRAGGALGKAGGGAARLVLAGAMRHAAPLVQALVLRAYSFVECKSRTEATDLPGAITVMAARPEDLAAAAAPLLHAAEGVYLTRDLVNEPANRLTTQSFAERIGELSALGVKVTVLDEEALAGLGMRLMLAVGQGSDSPSRLVVMEWSGGAPDAAPLALVGKGVVFDAGGISLKPAQGMEEMTMDMGGAGVVTGVMRTLAARKARANVVGLVGLVENMPSGRATRPGDVVASMKGDTVEIVNTDAEGRLVLADVLWYAQQTYRPAEIIDLATLTGAIIIGLGHEKAGVFSNDDGFCAAFLRAAEAEGEGAWRMPLDPAYDEKLKSDIADIKNVGGRPAGAVTAAQFLARFVEEDRPWIHLDIAGVARLGEDTALAPKGATGWGVRALDRLIAERHEAR